jgi:hypothetical protein
MGNSNEEFLRDCERDYPNQNWDEVSDDPEYQVIVDKGTVGKPWKTHEEAEACIERMKAGGVWGEAQLASARIIEVGSDISLCKQIREMILKGEINLPVYGP